MLDQELWLKGAPLGEKLELRLIECLVGLVDKSGILWIIELGMNLLI